MEINDNNISQLAVYLEQTLSPAAEVRSDFSESTFAVPLSLEFTMKPEVYFQPLSL